ncbi:hypothetical protein [Zoogloea sp.]|uniref:hypothetical protein n=1 Tax=Zoogloea sp. TaxID=49181 RepID=UPI002617C7EC|nr:hypothetical protein [Zoogloea sp.]MDD3354137.1 hypothetical protein [Zoogloea sp.]
MAQQPAFCLVCYSEKGLTVIVVAPDAYLGLAEEIAGRRRLLYVAQTRAKSGALLLRV